MHPAAIGCEHAIAFEDLARLAALGDAARQHVVDRFLHRGDGAAQALQLGLRILGDDLADQDARLVQHRASHGDPAMHAHPFEPHRQNPVAVRGLQLERIDQFARGDELGEDHGDRLHRLDLVLGVMAQRAVLHDENAQHPAAAQHGHADERVKNLLARLGAVGEIGMGLRIGERQGPRRRGDDADETFADAQPRAVHGFRAQALGREQLQHLARAHDVDRADLRHHLAGDDADDVIEALLRRARAGHDIAQPA